MNKRNVIIGSIVATSTIVGAGVFFHKREQKFNQEIDKKIAIRYKFLKSITPTAPAPKTRYLKGFLEFQNNSDVNIQLNALKFDIFYNEIKVGKVTFLEKKVIRPKTFIDIPLELTIPESILDFSRGDYAIDFSFGRTRQLYAAGTVLLFYKKFPKLISFSKQLILKSDNPLVSGMYGIQSVTNFTIKQNPELEKDCDYLTAKYKSLMSIRDEIGKKLKVMSVKASSLIENRENVLKTQETALKQLESLNNEMTRLLELQNKLNCKNKVGKGVISDCLAFDYSIKEYKEKIATLTAKITLSDTDKNLLESYRQSLMQIEKSFSQSNCRQEIEKLRLEETAILFSENAQKQEEMILPKNYSEQYLYIGVASIVLLVSLYIIVKE
jgi:hypothetical protein